MRMTRLVLRLLALVLAAFALGACATQPSDKVQVGIGTQAPALAQAKDYAALYAPYAMMATAAYANTLNLNSNHCPDYNRLRVAAPGESPTDAEYRTTVRGWIAELHAHGWECYTGVNGSLSCPPRLQPHCAPVGGLEFHVWRRMDGKNNCREVVVAFRGTDKGDLGDWISNFRWLNRLVPKFDQYAQVQDHITQVVRRLKRDCGGTAQFVSVGHSLGGGLAQQAAYADVSGSIKYVYGFDPSPVTGFFDVSELVRKHSTAGLGVDRAYEEGEILALPRVLIENIFPPADCHPRIRSVRFHVLTGLPGAQHSIEDLTKQLRVAAHQPGANPRRVYDGPKARGCTGSPMMVPPA
jgi:dienelactone hydrolase